MMTRTAVIDFPQSLLENIRMVTVKEEHRRKCIFIRILKPPFLCTLRFEGNGTGSSGLLWYC